MNRLFSPQNLRANADSRLEAKRISENRRVALIVSGSVLFALLAIATGFGLAAHFFGQ